MSVEDRYEFGEVLGSGAMGTVYRARQRGPGGRVVAVKRVRAGGDARLVERLRREGEVLAALDHPHVVRLFELLPDGDGLAIVMQYAPGGSLADVLAAHGPLPPEQVVRIAAPIADALASAHRRGVLHRDVKPANILFTSDGEPLLGDFGIARLSTAAPLTAPDAVGLGTAEYLDPEVADGSPPDPRSDVYALGVVCYEALTGAVPFSGPTPLAVLRAADRGGAVPVSERAPATPPALARVVEQALERSPRRRPADAAAFAAALREAGGAPAPAPAPLPPSPPAGARPGGAAPALPDRPPTRTFGPRPPAPEEAPARGVPKVLVGLVALALLVAPVALVLLLRPDPPPTPVAAALPDPTPTTLRADPAPAEDCPPVDAPETAPNETLHIGTLTPGACPSWVRFRPAEGNVRDNEVTWALRPGEPPVTFEIGRPGDVFLLGDWDCDGSDTPGLYSPDTGDVNLFDAWPDQPGVYEADQTRATGIRDGRPEVVESDEGCNDVLLDSPDPISA